MDLQQLLQYLLISYSLHNSPDFWANYKSANLFSVLYALVGRDIGVFPSWQESLVLFEDVLGLTLGTDRDLPSSNGPRKPSGDRPSFYGVHTVKSPGS